jgi:Asp-tRNA(Asn)/Glu-tRNA(Gln) amidotransferase A subunit family amidase
LAISNELDQMDALAQGNLVRCKEVKPTELVETAIERIELYSHVCKI